MNNRVNLYMNCDDLAWFETLPNEGDPDCICSYCGFEILEGDGSFIMIRPGDKTQARLHHRCLEMFILG